MGWVEAKLEVEFHTEFEVTRVTRRTNQAIRSVACDERAAANWVGVVEGVERFEAELASEALVELEVLEQR